MKGLTLLGSAQEPEIRQLVPETLDWLWHEAEQLGIVEVDSDWKGATYTAEIRFQRKSGTLIRARGYDSSIHVAMHKAILEAREMGAGTAE